MGFGLDGLITRNIEKKKQKERLGAFSYLLGILSGFIKQRKFSLRLKIDNQSYPFYNAKLAVVANNPYFGGGIKIVPHATNHDDLLEVLIADNVSLGNLFSILVKLLTNKSHLAHPKLHTYQASEIILEINSNQWAQKDGEVFQQDNYYIHFQTKRVPFWI
nr:hypothetical protein [Facklamia miroungae]